MSQLHIVASFAIVAGLVFAPVNADADQHRYLGKHPIHASQGGKFCYIEFPHVHVYPPSRASVIYRKHDGWHQFVGDPAAHGYDGKKHSFHGAHPVHQQEVVLGIDAPSEPVVHWCYLGGPHFHGYAPSATAKFEVKGGAAWYIGVYPPAFDRHKHRHVRINRFYVKRKYRRPVITVSPPSVYVDILAGGRGKRGRIKGGIKIKGGVKVRVPSPSVDIRVGGGVRVHGKTKIKIKSGGHGKYKRKHKGKRRKHRRHRF